MKPRDYQEDCHAAIFKAWETHPSTLVVAATGTGKTEVFVMVIKTMQPLRAMVLADRDELIAQAKNKIEMRTGLGVEIEKADQVASTSLFHKMPVVVSSIQTQISGPAGKRRYLRFDPMDFGVLICDEAHLACSPSWREVIAHYRTNPKLKLLGVTATPDRTDKLALGQVFESVAFEYPILQGIQDGWLVDITQQFVKVNGLDFSHVRTTAGDLNEGDLARVMEMEENIQGVCQPTIEVMYGLEPKTLNAMPVCEWRAYLAALGRKPRRTIIFTVSVAQAEMCCNIFRRAMDGIEWVSGKTPMDKRQTILKQFQAGEVHAVVNCGVLVTGYDNPFVEVIVMAAPTKSRLRYTQKVGRATRPLPGLVDPIETADGRRAAIAASPKPFCRILDFCGNSGRHKLITCLDILGGKISDEASERARKKAVEDGKPKKVLVTLANAELELEKEKREEARVRDEARKKDLLARSNFTSKSVNPFDAGDSFTGVHNHISRDGVPLKEGTLRILRQRGINPTTVTRNQIRGIIAAFFETPSESQAKTLRRAGYDPMKFNRKTASLAIDALAKNGWKKPEPAYEPF